MDRVAPDIVLIEDSPDEAELTTLAIRKYDRSLTVEVTGDGQAALDLMQSFDTTPCLVLLNVHLARLGGLEVLEVLRADQTYRYTPIVIMTSDPSPEVLLRAYELGANSFIRKPYNAEESESMLERLLSYWFSLNQVP